MAMMYDVRRLQIYIEEELDDQLALEAARSGTSKAALVRAAVGARYRCDRRRRDSLDEIVGISDYSPQGESIDDVVYGR